MLGEAQLVLVSILVRVGQELQEVFVRPVRLTRRQLLDVVRHLRVCVGVCGACVFRGGEGGIKHADQYFNGSAGRWRG